MTVDSTTNRAEFTGDGSNTLFDFSFRVLAKSDLSLSVYDTVTGITTAVDSSNFTVTTLPADSGTITYPVSGTALASDERLIVVRELSQTQTVDINNQTGFDAEVQEQAFDKLTMLVQQLAEELGRALKLPVADGPGPDVPSGVARAGRFLGFDDAGDLTVFNGDGGNAVDTPWQGAWVTGIFYAVNDLVGESGNIYICVEAHTAGTFATDLAAGKWELFVTSGAGTLDIDGLTELTLPDAADTLGIYDASAGANFKLALSNLFNFLPSLTAETDVRLVDELGMYDTSASGSRAITIQSLFNAINNLTPNTAPTSTDRIPYYSGTDSAARRISFENALKIINSLSSLSAPALTDEFVLYDASDSDTKKLPLSDVLKVINLLTADGTPDLAADYVATYDASAGVPKKVLLNTIAGGGWTFIATADAASSATIDFTGFDDALYDGYAFLIQNLRPATDGAGLIARTSANGGSTYDSGGGNYKYAIMGVETSASGTAVLDASGSATGISLSGGIGNAAGEDGISGIVFVSGPHLTLSTHVGGTLSYENTSGIFHSITVNGLRNSNAATDAIRFLMSTGNISTGTITMYGLKAL